MPEKFKDETLGRQIVSYVGLRAKLYSLLIVDDELEVSKKVFRNKKTCSEQSVEPSTLPGLS